MRAPVASPTPYPRPLWRLILQPAPARPNSLRRFSGDSRCIVSGGRTSSRYADRKLSFTLLTGQITEGTEETAKKRRNGLPYIVFSVTSFLRVLPLSPSPPLSHVQFQNRKSRLILMINARFLRSG